VTRRKADFAMPMRKFSGTTTNEDCDVVRIAVALFTLIFVKSSQP